MTDLTNEQLRQMCRTLLDALTRDSDNHETLAVIAQTGQIAVAADLVPWFDPGFAAKCIMNTVDLQRIDATQLGMLSEGLKQLKPAFDGRYSTSELDLFGANVLLYFQGEFSRNNLLCSPSQPPTAQKNAADVTFAVIGALRDITPKEEK